MDQLQLTADATAGLSITGNPDYSGTPFAAFESVNSLTRLEDLNLNWRERDLPEKERTKHVHRLHPYLGKFIPQLVEIFLRKYFAAGQTVLDPFSGSGTTLVQANELGIHSIGFDVSAFNVLLARAKTANYDVDRFAEDVMHILHRVRRSTQVGARQLSLYTDSQPVQTLNLASSDSDYLSLWYAPEALTELLTYRAFIELGNYRYPDLLKVILCRSARSARLTTHYELDFPRTPQIGSYQCHKHDRECSPTTTAFKFLERYSLDTVRRVREFAKLRTNAFVDVRHVDSRQADAPLIDGILTSPPYVGLIDYHQQHAYAYHLLGLQDLRTEEIGAAVNGSSERARAAYQRDIAAVFERAAIGLKPGGRFIVVAGDRHELYPQIASLAGLEQETMIHRHVNRRTGRRSTAFFETVFVWRKP